MTSTRPHQPDRRAATGRLRPVGGGAAGRRGLRDCPLRGMGRSPCPWARRSPGAGRSRRAAPGQQRLTVTLLLRWKPQAGTSGVSQREAMAFSRGLNVEVVSFFGLTRGQAMTGGHGGAALRRRAGALLGGLAGCAHAARCCRRCWKTRSLRSSRKPGLQVDFAEATACCARLFGRYARLVLESEFLSGYSGARTFLAQPIRPDGRADAYTIVKVGSAAAIQREVRELRDLRQGHACRRSRRASSTPRSPCAAARTSAPLQYTFIAEPGRLPTQPAPGAAAGARPGAAGQAVRDLRTELVDAAARLHFPAGRRNMTGCCPRIT